MQQSLGGMTGHEVKATDGDLGKVYDFYFDDESWTIRYMVAKTGNWLSGRKALISLSSLDKSDCESCMFTVNLTRDQVRNSPLIDTEKPVHRQYEAELHRHYQLPLYWQGGYGGIFGMNTVPFFVSEEPDKEDSCSTGDNDEHHLRSSRQIAGYNIHATNGKIGRVEDFIVEKDTWIIRYVVVNAQSCLPGRLVLVSPQWIKNVDWDKSKIFVDISKEDFMKSPVFDPSKPISPEYESMLCKHLKKPGPSEWVTFRFHYPDPRAEIHIAGTFNNWRNSEIRLHHFKNNLYAASILLPQGRYEYKFIVNGIWCNGDSKEQAPNPFGTTNNVLVVSGKKAHKGHAHTFSRMSVSESPLLWNTSAMTA